MPFSFSVYLRGGILIPQIQRLEAQARANVAANAAAYDAWVKTHTPLQIRDANSARLTLSRIGTKNYPSIRDDRLPKIPNSAYVLFVKDRLDTHVYRGKSGRDTFTAISEEWPSLPQSEKDVRIFAESIHTYQIQALTMNLALPQIANRRSSTV